MIFIENQYNLNLIYASSRLHEMVLFHTSYEYMNILILRPALWNFNNITELDNQYLKRCSARQTLKQHKNARTKFNQVVVSESGCDINLAWQLSHKEHEIFMW